MPGARFKDSIQIKGKESAILLTVISLESALQRGSQWTSFLELVDHCFLEKTLSKLIIVTTGHLQRHYFSLELEKPLEEKEIEEKTIALDQQWLEKQSASLNKLKIPVEILHWKDLLNKLTVLNGRSFLEFSQLIQSDYANNKEFKHLVDKHADGYVNRKFIQQSKVTHFDCNQFHQAAVDYVLEECAAIQQLFRCNADLLTYPHGINPPASYVWSKYFKEESLRYVRYKTKNNNLEANKKLSAQHYLAGYVDGSLRGKSWNLFQECLFIRGVKALIDAINAKEQQIS